MYPGIGKQLLVEGLRHLRVQVGISACYLGAEIVITVPSSELSSLT